MDRESSVDDKIKIAENLLQSVTDKSDVISSQIRHLKCFNKRLELLLGCFKAYSFAESGTASSTKSTSVKSSEYNAKRVKPNSHAGTADKSGETVPDRRNLECEISRLFEGCKANKSLAMGIYNLVKQREPITFDDLVKGIKQSKYKVIDTINVLIKERVIVKSFDKGFVYRLDK